MSDTPKRGIWKALTTPTGLRAPGYVEPPPITYGRPQRLKALACWAFMAFFLYAAYAMPDLTKGDTWWIGIPGCVLLAGLIPMGWFYWTGRGVPSRAGTSNVSSTDGDRG